MATKTTVIKTSMAGAKKVGSGSSAGKRMMMVYQEVPSSVSQSVLQQSVSVSSFTSSLETEQSG